MIDIHGLVWRAGNLLALCSLCFLLGWSGAPPWIVAVAAYPFAVLWLLSPLRRRS